MTIHPVAILHKVNAVLLATLKPLGIWGLAGLALIDSALIPLPTTMNGVVLYYVNTDHRKLVVYCIVAAVASAIGSMLPYYVGRAGGELFLLKRINRERYEKMRDRFERQEFVAIMVPAMMPPPVPIKLFEFAAGVFEMKPLLFATAIFSGKLVQFLAWSVAYVFFGPKIIHAGEGFVHRHSEIVLGIAVAAGAGFLFYVLRKLFDRRRGSRFPTEEEPAPAQQDIADGDDSTLIT